MLKHIYRLVFTLYHVFSLITTFVYINRLYTLHHYNIIICYYIRLAGYIYLYMYRHFLNTTTHTIVL